MFVECNGDLRTLLFVEDPIWGGAVSSSGHAGNALSFDGESDFTPLLGGRKDAHPATPRTSPRVRSDQDLSRRLRLWRRMALQDDQRYCIGTAFSPVPWVCPRRPTRGRKTAINITFRRSARVSWIGAGPPSLARGARQGRRRRRRQCGFVSKDDNLCRVVECAVFF